MFVIGIFVNPRKRRFFFNLLQARQSRAQPTYLGKSRIELGNLLGGEAADPVRPAKHFVGRPIAAPSMIS